MFSSLVVFFSLSSNQFNDPSGGVGVGREEMSISETSVLQLAAGRPIPRYPGGTGAMLPASGTAKLHRGPAGMVRQGYDPLWTLCLYFLRLELHTEHGSGQQRKLPRSHKAQAVPVPGSPPCGSMGRSEVPGPCQGSIEHGMCTDPPAPSSGYAS